MKVLSRQAWHWHHIPEAKYEELPDLIWRCCMLMIMYKDSQTKPMQAQVKYWYNRCSAIYNKRRGIQVLKEIP